MAREKINEKIEIEQSGEIPWGAPLYKLWVNGEEFKDRRFLKLYCRSKDNRHFAITEYFFLDRGYSYTQILLFDFMNNKIYSYGRMKEGRIIPCRFEEERLVFNREKPPGLVRELEIDIAVIKKRNYGLP